MYTVTFILRHIYWQKKLWIIKYIWYQINFQDLLFHILNQILFFTWYFYFYSKIILGYFLKPCLLHISHFCFNVYCILLWNSIHREEWFVCCREKCKVRSLPLQSVWPCPFFFFYLQIIEEEVITIFRLQVYRSWCTKLSLTKRLQMITVYF